MGLQGSKADGLGCPRLCCSDARQSYQPSEETHTIERKIYELKCAFDPQQTESLRVKGWDGSDPQQLTLIRAHLMFALLPHCNPQRSSTSKDGALRKPDNATVVDADGIAPLLQGFADPNLAVQLPAAIALALLTTKNPKASAGENEATVGSRAASKVITSKVIFRRILAHVKIAMSPVLDPSADLGSSQQLELRKPDGRWNTQGELLLLHLKLSGKELEAEKLPSCRLPEVLSDGAYSQAVICLLANLIDQWPMLAPQLIQEEVWLLYHFRAVRRELRKSLHVDQLENISLLPHELLNPTHWPNSQCPFHTQFCNADAIFNFHRVLSSLERSVWADEYEGTTAQVHGLVALCLDYQGSSPVFEPTENSVAVYVTKKEMSSLVERRAQQLPPTCRMVLARCLKILQSHKLSAEHILGFEVEVASPVHPSSWPGIAPDMSYFSALCAEGTKLGSGLITQKPTTVQLSEEPVRRISGAAVETNKERALLTETPNQTKSYWPQMQVKHEDDDRVLDASEPGYTRQ